MTEFDIFISYNWDVKSKVLKLYKELTERHNLKVWLDDFEMGPTRLNDELSNAILKSKVIISCITAKYCQSKNCKNELDYAENNNKKIIVLMFERLTLVEMGGVGFTIGPMVRFNCYKTPDLFEKWTGSDFNPILSAINVHLNKKPESLPTNSNNSNEIGFKQESNIKDYITDDNINKFNELNVIKEHKTSVGLPYYNIPPLPTSPIKSKSETSNTINLPTVEDTKPPNAELETTEKTEDEQTVLDQDFLVLCGFKKSDANILLKTKRIVSIDQFAFRGWKQIEGIFLHDNLITDLEYGTFNGLYKLNTLSMEFNCINSIENGIFNSLANLQYLKLNCNQIKTVDKSAFNGLYNLKSLDLSNNVIKNLDKSTFGDLINLLSLYLNNNLIKHIDGSIFSCLVSLESLDLHGNFVKKFEEPTFKNLKNLKYLDLLDNPLDSFDGNSTEFDNVEVSV